MTDLKLRRATVEDVAIITGHRIQMFIDMGEDADELEEIREPYMRWLKRQIERDDYIGVLVCDGETVVAGGGFWRIRDYPPYSGNLAGERAMIFNMYTDPGFRRRGIAKRIMEEFLRIAVELEIPVLTLHASQDGRPLYERLGFKQTNEMRRES